MRSPTLLISHECRSSPASQVKSIGKPRISRLRRSDVRSSGNDMCSGVCNVLLSTTKESGPSLVTCVSGPPSGLSSEPAMPRYEFSVNWAHHLELVLPQWLWVYLTFTGDGTLLRIPKRIGHLIACENDHVDLRRDVDDREE